MRKENGAGEEQERIVMTIRGLSAYHTDIAVHDELIVWLEWSVQLSQMGDDLALSHLRGFHVEEEAGPVKFLCTAPESGLRRVPK